MAAAGGYASRNTPATKRDGAPLVTAGRVGFRELLTQEQGNDSVERRHGQHGVASGHLVQTEAKAFPYAGGV